MMNCVPTSVPHAEAWLQLIAQFRTEYLTIFFRMVSQIMGEGMILLILVTGYWFWDKRLFYRIGLLSLFSLGVNVHLKGLVMECRPISVPHLQVAEGFSFPSGHAQAAAVLFGSLAQTFKNKLYAFLLITLAILICFSRTYLGVHFAHDVLIGLCLGFLIILMPWPTTWLTRYPLKLQIGIVLALLFFWGLTIYSPVGKTWKYMGAIFGFWLGGQLEQRILNFKPQLGKHTWWQILLGGMGAFFFWKGISYLFKHLSIENDVLDFLTFSLLGFWVTFAAPWLFTHLTNCHKQPIQIKSSLN